MKNCKHPKKHITITEENSYTDEGYGCDIWVKVQQWKCTKCNQLHGSNLTHNRSDVCYYNFTGRNYDEDFKKELKRERVKRARQNLKYAKRELELALKS